MPDQFEPALEFTAKDEINLLMKEYLALRGDIIEYVRQYRAHVRNASVILTIIVALLPLMGKDSGFYLWQSRVFCFFFSVSITTVISYFAFDALEAQYAMFATAARAGTIEKMINDRARSVLLVWESQLSDYFWTSKLPHEFWAPETPQ
jgi:hypothetical protein